MCGRKHLVVLAHHARAGDLHHNVDARITAAHNLPSVRYARVRRDRQRAQQRESGYREPPRSADAAQGGVEHRLQL